MRPPLVHVHCYHADTRSVVSTPRAIECCDGRRSYLVKGKHSQRASHNLQGNLDSTYLTVPKLELRSWMVMLSALKKRAVLCSSRDVSHLLVLFETRRKD